MLGEPSVSEGVGRGQMGTASPPGMRTGHRNRKHAAFHSLQPVVQSLDCRRASPRGLGARRQPRKRQERRVSGSGFFTGRVLALSAQRTAGPCSPPEPGGSRPVP